MRALWAILILIVLTGAAASEPSLQLAAIWWSHLSDDRQHDIQFDLVLTGDYGALVDGEFGPATLQALRKYQARLGQLQNGILSNETIARLDQDAEEVFARLGMDAIHDKQSGLTAFIPRALLTQTKREEGGTAYYSPDGEISFHAVGLGSGTLQAVQAALVEPAAGKVVTYSVLKPGRVVVSGTWGDHTFYTTFTDVGGDIVGFNVNWTDRYRSVGKLTATFAASSFAPSRLLQSTETAGPQQPAQHGAASNRHIEPGERVGAFLLPDGRPTEIALVDEIRPGAALDFRRALRERPTADTLLLSSGGGSVNEALLVAHETSDRALSTVVPAGSGCYSACAYIFFAGKSRTVMGELGVHQIYGDGLGASDAQTAMSDVLDALSEFGTPENVISVMLRTPPEEMHVFTLDEIVRYSINRRDTGAVAGSLGPR